VSKGSGREQGDLASALAPAYLGDEVDAPMIHSTVTSRGQTTLPKAVREALGLKPGDRLSYVIEEGEVRIRRPRSILELAGMLKAYAPDPPTTLEEMDEAIAEAAAERGMAGLEPAPEAGRDEEPGRDAQEPGRDG
jgi:AbrB family looped-hinge helix DNA binding protein